jgi:hypothetical protein
MVGFTFGDECADETDLCRPVGTSLKGGFSDREFNS